MSNEKQLKSSLLNVIKTNIRAYKLLYTHGFKSFFISAFFYSIFVAIIPYVNLFIFALIVQEIADGDDKEALIKLVVINIIVIAVLTLVRAILMRWKEYCRSTVQYKLDNVLIQKLFDMDFCDIDSNSTHSKISHIKQTANYSGHGLNLQIYTFESFVTSFVSIFTGLGLTIKLFSTSVLDTDSVYAFIDNPVIAISTIVLMIIITIVSPILYSNAQSSFVKFSEEAKLANRLYSYSYNLTQKIFYEDSKMFDFTRLLDYFQSHNTLFIPGGKLSKRALGIDGVKYGLSGSLMQILVGIVYLYVCIKALGGAINIGDVTKYIGALAIVFASFSEFVKSISNYYHNTKALQLFFEFYDIENKMQSGEIPLDRKTIGPIQIEFKNVSFKYLESDEYTLKNISIKFKEGERLAVVGMNGSGKTTFIKLLCRLYDPTEGEILLNGINIKNYKYEDYLSVFSVVFQDFNLLSFELGKNITCNHDYDEKRITQILKDVGFEEKLLQMPKGLNTILNKDFDTEGAKLSGGEEQKIAIARAIYKDSPFIILDEPTAALDPIAEFEIYSKMNEIVQNKTAVFISHRLSSCRFCHNIVVFNDGEIIQKGSHDELIQQTDNKYYELWNAQAQYYTD